MAARMILAAALCAPLALGLNLPTAATAQNAAAQVQALEEEVRRLNGRIQELEFLLRRIAEDAAFRIHDLDYRVTELEGGDPTILGDPPPLGGGAARRSGGGASTPPVTVSEQAELDDATALLEGGDAAGARARLSAFLATYPDGPLAGEARHRLGLAEFQLGEWRAAAQSFLAYVTEVPGGPREPESFLMLGRSLARLGRLEQACSTWEELRARHRGSDASQAAASDRAVAGCI
ncbi:MAG: tetratricopeptide repeat protein [Pseudomonadota bacterium]